MRMSIIDANTQRKEITQLEQKIKQNEKTIEDLKSGGGGKDKRVSGLELKIEEVQKKIVMQEKLLQQLKEAHSKLEQTEKKKD